MITFPFSRILTWRRLLYVLALLVIFGNFRVSVLGGWDESFYWAQHTPIWRDADLTLHDDLLANHNHFQDQFLTLTKAYRTGIDLSEYQHLRWDELRNFSPYAKDHAHR